MHIIISRHCPLFPSPSYSFINVKSWHCRAASPYDGQKYAQEETFYWQQSILLLLKFTGLWYRQFNVPNEKEKCQVQLRQQLLQPGMCCSIRRRITARGPKSNVLLCHKQWVWDFHNWDDIKCKNTAVTTTVDRKCCCVLSATLGRCYCLPTVRKWKGMSVLEANSISVLLGQPKCMLPVLSPPKYILCLSCWGCNYVTLEVNLFVTM
jgi:hypothetical protein